jgi:hypothetical protein
VDQIEAGAGNLARLVAQELPERLGRRGVEHAGGDRPLQVPAPQGRCLNHDCRSIR